MALEEPSMALTIITKETRDGIQIFQPLEKKQKKGVKDALGMTLNCGETN